MSPYDEDWIRMIDEPYIIDPWINMWKCIGELHAASSQGISFKIVERTCLAP